MAVLVEVTEAYSRQFAREIDEGVIPFYTYNSRSGMHEVKEGVSPDALSMLIPDGQRAKIWVRTGRWTARGGDPITGDGIVNNEQLPPYGQRMIGSGNATATHIPNGEFVPGIPKT